MRSPSVTTATRTSCCCQALSFLKMLPRSRKLMYKPCRTRHTRKQHAGYMITSKFGLLDNYAKPTVSCAATS